MQRVNFIARSGAQVRGPEKGKIVVGAPHCRDPRIPPGVELDDEKF
jgi:hypothetical protein